MNSFQPVRTIRSQVYQAIRQQIISGAYPPGFWLQEQEIAASLQVSRSPVREALRQIVSDGLADEIPNKGVFVRTLTRRDVDELCELRVLIEGYSIRRGYAHCTPEQKEEMEKLLQAMEQAHVRGDVEQYIELDSQMHMLFVEQCGNRLLQDMYKRAYWMVQRFRVYSLKSEDRFRRSLAEHRQIMEAILSGDWEKAVEQDRIHLEAARETVYQYLDQFGEQE